MKVQEQHTFHGSALTQIVEHESFKALNRGSRSYGHYLINTDRHVFAKYRTKSVSPWQFTFQKDELAAIRSACSLKNARVFIALVCGPITICALTVDELREVVDLNSTGQQSVWVNVPKGGSCHVEGSKVKLSRAIPHNSFPQKLFD